MRNAQMLEFCKHYGLTIATCVPAIPASKGGSENAVKIAKLVPTETNLLAPGSFGELQSAACAGQQPCAPGDPAHPRENWSRNAPGCTRCPSIPTPPRSGSTCTVPDTR